MAIIKALVFTCFVAMVAAELGTNSDINEWGYQWYEDESFKFTYTHPSQSNITSPAYLIVYWETPSKHVIRANLNDDDFKVTDSSAGVKNGVIEINKLTADKWGVYICHVYLDDGTGNMEMVNRTIFGINVREPLYHSMNEKYRNNVVVAVIATAVFIVPLLTMCITYRFRYEERHGMTKKNPKYAYTDNGHEMKRDIASSVQAEFGPGAYDNPEFKSPSTTHL